MWACDAITNFAVSLISYPRIVHCIKNMAPTGQFSCQGAIMINVSGCWLFSHSSFFSYWIEVIYCEYRRLYNGKTPFYSIYSLVQFMLKTKVPPQGESGHNYFKLYESLHVINLYYVKFISSVWECKYFTRLPEVEEHCKTNKIPSTADNNNMRSKNISVQL